MNRPPGRAYPVEGNRAMWRCVCQAGPTLHGASGSTAGPTRDSAIVCPGCGRVYFVIPMDRSHGPPIEVVELFGLPAPEPASTTTESGVA